MILERLRVEKIAPRQFEPPRVNSILQFAEEPVNSTPGGLVHADRTPPVTCPAAVATAIIKAVTLCC